MCLRVRVPFHPIERLSLIMWLVILWQKNLDPTASVTFILYHVKNVFRIKRWLVTKELTSPGWIKLRSRLCLCDTTVLSSQFSERRKWWNRLCERMDRKSMDLGIWQIYLNAHSRLGEVRPTEWESLKTGLGICIPTIKCTQIWNLML